MQRFGNLELCQIVFVFFLFFAEKHHIDSQTVTL
jgi:hypothetical protein